MAKVNLTRKTVVPVTPQQAPDPELLARVTGQRRLPPVPQAANRPVVPGVRGTPPLPLGGVVGFRAPGSLTPAELSKLESLGWTPDMPIPKDMAGVLQQVQQEQLASVSEVNLPLPVPPNTPPLQVKTQEYADLTPAQQRQFDEKQQRFRELMQQQAQQEVANQEAISQQETMRQREMHTPGIAAAMQAAGEIENDLGQAGVTAVATPPPELQKAAASAAQSYAAATGQPEVVTQPPEPAPASETGADPKPTTCPHCEWDLSIPDIKEPSYHEKLGFLQAVLGQKPWTKDYQLFNGSVTVTYRTLCSAELDVIYEQAYFDKEAGKLPTNVDYWEQINRYRLFLQLVSLRSIGPNGFIHELPEGYTKETNPDAASVWESEDPLPPRETMLPSIEKRIIGDVLKTEMIYRIVHNHCNQFNRLVAKMEALVDKTDFWKLTEVPS